VVKVAFGDKPMIASLKECYTRIASSNLSHGQSLIRFKELYINNEITGISSPENSYYNLNSLFLQ